MMSLSLKNNHEMIIKAYKVLMVPNVYFIGLEIYKNINICVNVFFSKFQNFKINDIHKFNSTLLVMFGNYEGILFLNETTSRNLINRN